MCQLFLRTNENRVTHDKQTIVKPLKKRNKDKSESGFPSGKAVTKMVCLLLYIVLCGKKYKWKKTVCGKALNFAADRKFCDFKLILLLMCVRRQIQKAIV